MKNKISDSVRIFTGISAAFLSVLFGICALTAYLTPSQIILNEQKNEFLGNNFPISLKFDKNTQTYPAFGDEQDIPQNNTTAEIMLFDSVPVKQVNVNVTQRKNVILGGTPFGIRIYTDGLVVSGTSPVKTADGNKYPPNDAGIKSGDIIISVNGKKINTNEELVSIVEKSNGHSIDITARNNGNEYFTKITPAFDSSLKKYRIGLMVRDSCAGIGTMTFIDPENGTFAGLGHGICDTKSGCLMPLQSGDIVDAEINSITKSVCGNPGALTGFFVDTSSKGIINSNSQSGIYGSMSEYDSNAQTIPVLFKQEIERGPAKILTTINGHTPKYYDITIEDISYNNMNMSKNMTIRITDPELIEKTGGIVQGMSGSPIIQHGQLAGAVTHVFVNDPTGGYGVFAENMIYFSSKSNNKTSLPNAG